MLFGKKTYDVIVLGLGAVGSAALYQLSKSNKKILGIDQYAPPHIYGSTHGNSRIIRQAYYEGKQYIPILQAAYEEWREIEKRNEASFFEITGALMMGTRYNSIVDQSELSAQAYDLPYELMDSQEIAKRFKPFKPESSTWALLDKLAGYVIPEKAVESQLQLAKNNGAKFGLNEMVEFWDAESYTQGIRVKTNKGDYFAEKLIVSTGAWAKGMMQELGVTLKPERLVQYWVKPKRNIATFSKNQFPIFLWNVERDLDIYGFPILDQSEGVCKVAFYSHGDHQIREFCTAYNIDREVTENDLSLMRKYLEQYVPDLAGEVLKTSVCMHTESPDLHPIIDFHPEHSQVCIANGFSGHGFKFSNITGKILADLTLVGKTDFDVSLFSAERFAKRLQ